MERKLEQVEKEIEETKKALKEVHGTETEVYARIVGYYRAVKNWNKGKRHEFDLRKTFSIKDNIKCEEKKQDSIDSVETKSVENVCLVSEKPVMYELFIRKTCPNCPPVKKFMAELDMPGHTIDVDTKEGLSEAGNKGIFSSPTVIFYDEGGNETVRCHNVEELENLFKRNSDVA